MENIDIALFFTIVSNQLIIVHSINQYSWQAEV